MAKRKTMKYRAENNPKAWLYLLPFLIIIAIFHIFPLVKMFMMSVQTNDLAGGAFCGLENFQFVLKDPDFWMAIKNTFIYGLVVVPVGMIISMFIAVNIHEKIKHKNLCETIFFIPYLTSVIAIGIVFRALFNHDYGMINYLLKFIGVGPINFLNDPAMSLPTVIIFGIWSSLAFNIIILLSGLRAIDKEYYKLADIFGATRFEQFRKITLPQLIPIMTFLIMVNFINAFKVYAQVFSLFNGQPGISNSATTAIFYIYNKFYQESLFGQGMAAAVIFFVMVLIFTFIQNWVMKKIAK